MPVTKKKRENRDRSKHDEEGRQEEEDIEEDGIAKRQKTLDSGTDKNDEVSNLLARIREAYKGQGGRDGNDDGYRVARTVIQDLKHKKEYDKLEGLTYGEIDISAFAELLQQINDEHITKGDTSASYSSPTSFYDIGSGTGLAVLVAACVWRDSLTVSCGIEIVKELHEKATAVCANFQAALDFTVPCKIELRHDDTFALTNWHSADILYAPITCWTDGMIQQVCRTGLNAMKPNSVVITVTHKLPKDARSHKLLFSRRCKYGRGSPMFHVYRLLEQDA